MKPLKVVAESLPSSGLVAVGVKVVVAVSFTRAVNEIEKSKQLEIQLK